MVNQLIPIGDSLFNYAREQASTTIGFNHFLYQINLESREEYNLSNCKTCQRNYLSRLKTKILGYVENHPKAEYHANYFLSRLNEIKVLNKKKQLMELEKIFSLNSE